MALAFDAVSGATGGASFYTNATNSLSWTHTVGGSVTNGVIIIVAQCDVAGSGFSMSATCSTGSVASLGLISTSGQTSSPSVSFVQMWIVTGVSTGANTVQVTASTQPTDLGGGSVSYGGYTSHGTLATNFSASTIANATVTSTTNANGNTVVGVIGQGGTIVQATSPATGRILNNGAGMGGDTMGDLAVAEWPSTGSSVVTNWTSTFSTGVLAIELQGATALSVTTTSLPNAVVGSAYSQTLTATGGSGTGYTWAVSSGSLPSWASLNSSTGAITGTPSTSVGQGPTTFTVQVTDSLSATATQVLMLDVVTYGGASLTDSVPGQIIPGFRTALPGTVSGAASITTTVLPGTVAFSAPALSTGESTITSVLAGSAAFSAPTIHAGSGITTTVLAGTSSFAGGLVVNAGSGFTTSVLAGTVAFTAPTLTVNSSITTSVLAGTVAFTAPTVLAVVSVTTTVLAVTVSFTAPTVTVNAPITTSVLSGTTSFYAPSFLITTSVLSGSVSFVTPAVLAGGNATIMPSVLSTSVSFPAASILVNTSVLSGSVSFPAPTVNAFVSITTSVLNGSVTFPAVTTNAGSGITSSALSASVAFTSPAITVNNSITASVLNGSVSFTAVTVNISKTFTTSLLATSASFNVVIPSNVLEPSSLAGSVSFSPPSVMTGLPFITSIAGTGTGQYWIDQSGHPIMMKSDTPWALAYNAGIAGGATTVASDITNYCATRASQGFNCFLIAAVGTSQIGTTDNGHTWDGIAPFTSPGVLNNTFWNRVDLVISTAAGYGLTVILNPMFTYCIADGGGSMNSWTTANFTTYGTNVGNRYKNATNLLWEMGDDYGGGSDPSFNAFYSALRAAGANQLLSVENLTPGDSRFSLSGGTYAFGTSNANWNWCYGYGAAYNSVEYAYKESSPLLVMKMDGAYDDGGNSDPIVYWRNWAWWSLSSGSRGFQYGRNDVFPWSSSALAALTNNTIDNTQFKEIWNIYESFNEWWLLVPDTSSTLVTAGRGTRWLDSNDSYTTASSNTYVTASYTPDGKLAVIYNPAANTQTITVNGSVMVAGYTATWIDPISGATTNAGISSTYTNSSTNSVGGHDWLLVLQAPTTTNASITTSAFNISAAFSAPSISTGEKITTTVLSGTVIFPSPLVDLGIVPSTFVTSVAFPTFTPQISENIIPSALATNTVFTTPAVVSAIVPSTLHNSVAFSSPTINAGSGTSPSTMMTPVSFPAITVNAGEGITTAVLNGTANFTTPAVSSGGGTSITTSVLPVSANFTTPVVHTSDNVTIPPLSVSVNFSSPAISAGSGTTTNVLSVAATFPSVGITAISNAGITTSALTVSASFPAPSIHSNAAFTTTALSGSASFSAPAITNIIAITTSLLSNGAAFFTPIIQNVTVLTPSSLASSVAFPALNLHTSEVITTSVLSSTSAFFMPAIFTGGSIDITTGTLNTSASYPDNFVIRSDCALTEGSFSVPHATFTAPTVDAGTGITPNTFAGTVSFAMSINLYCSCSVSFS